MMRTANLKFLISTISLFVISLTALAQQTGSIKGQIISTDNHPVSYISIGLKNRPENTTTKEDGSYILTKIKAGSYVLRVSGVGITAQEKTVTVIAGQAVEVDFKLTETNEILQEVTISSKNKNKEQNTIAKMPLKNLENPQVYSSVSADLIKEQGIVNYDDALRNVPGISRTWESTGRGGDGASYFALRGFEAQTSVINGLPGLTSGNLDPANVQEIQVVKGPSATLFGGGFYAYGGFINTITKKPYYNFGGEVAYNIGSFGLHRITADVNTPLSKKEKIALRLNAALHKEDSFQDAGFRKALYIAPTLAYEVNDRLSLNIMAEILEEKRAVAPIFFNSDRSSPLDFKNISELNLNYNLSFTNNDLTIKNPRKNLQAVGVYKINEQWTSQTAVSLGSTKADGIYSYIWDDAAGDNLFQQYFNRQNQTTKTIDIQQNFNGDFKIGNLRNRLLVGLDYFRRKVESAGSGWAVARNVTPQGQYYDYTTGASIPASQLSKAYVDQILAASTAPDPTEIVNSSASAYASNVLNLSEKFLIMASLRADYFNSKGEVNNPDDDYNQFVLSPKFGLIYQPIQDKVSLFANYMNAFFNVAPQEVFDDNQVSLGVKSFKPERANQWELGAKLNLLSNKLFATVSYYDIKVANRVFFTTTSAVQGGKTGSKGFEVELSANPLANLSLIGGFSHGKIQVLTGNSGLPNDFYNQVGSAPGGQGPQTLANFWANYKFANGTLKGLGIGVGGNYAGVYKVIDNSITGVFKIPSYALLNASLSYDTKYFRVSCTANNITNKEYYIGYWSVNPQKPRNFVSSFSYKF